MNFDSGPPKRKPPNIGKKPVKKNTEDAEMANEEKKEPARPPPKRPAPSSDKPKALPSSGKGPVAPVI